MELVIIPAWKRADFLFATLKRLEQTEDRGAVAFWICPDRKASPEVISVSEQFARAHGARLRLIEHEFKGNSFNVLTAYLEACSLDPTPSLVHLIEEDIFVGRDYFTFHRRAHELCPEAFAVSACKNQNVDVAPSGNADAIYMHLSYQSLGVSFKPRQLEEILIHVRPEYFYDPVDYCKLMFPDYVHGEAFAEQDGLIRRVGEFVNRMVVYPFVPRAYHAGFHGYNRKGDKLVGGSAASRASSLLDMTSEQLNAQASSHPDHETIDLDARRSEVTHVVS